MAVSTVTAEKEELVQINGATLLQRLWFKTEKKIVDVSF